MTLPQRPIAPVLAILFLLLPTSVPALDCVDYSTNPQWLSSLDLDAWRAVVAAAGDFAYVGTTDCCPSQARLRVVDLADPASPILRASLDVAAQVQAIAVLGSHVLLLAENHGVVVADVSDPDAPFVVTTYPSTTTRGFELSGTLVYLLNENGVDVLDVTDPTTPLLVGNSAGIPLVQFVVTGPSRAVALGPDFLYVYDLTDPTSPVLAGDLEADPNCWPGDCSWFAHVAGTGDVAWVVRRRTWCTDVDCICTKSSTQLVTYDLSDPSTPATVGSTDLPAAALGLELSQDRLHVFAAGDRIFDVSDPANPTLIHGLPDTAPGIVHTNGPSDLLLCGGSALQVFDVTNADRPHGVSMTTASSGVDIALREDSVLLYGSTSTTPCGFGCTWLCSHVKEAPIEPEEPITEWVGCGCGYGYFNGWVRDVEVANDDLYLAITGVAWGSNLFRADLAGMGEPLPAPEELPLSVEPSGLAVQDPYLLVAEGAGGVSVIDASADPPALVTPATGPDTQMLETSGVLAAAIGWDVVPDDVAFRTMDVSVPTAPAVLGEVTWTRDDPYGFSYWVTVEGSVAVVGHKGGLLRILDVSDPLAPRVAAQVAASTAGGWGCRSGSLGGSVLYASVDHRGILAFDVSDPDAPVFRGAIATGAAPRILATPGAIYAAVGSGVVTLPPDCASTLTTDLPGVTIAPSALALAVEPNPFADDVRLRWATPGVTSSELAVFDVTGRRVRSLAMPRAAAARGTASWDGRDGSGRDVTPGVYFVRLRTGNDAVTRKIVRVR